MHMYEATVADVHPLSRRRLGAEPRCAPHCASLCTGAGLAEAYRSFARELAGFCRRALGDPWLAEEITQEVFVKAWRHCARFDGREEVWGAAEDFLQRSRLRPWLFAIARNAVIDAARRRGRRPVLAADPEQVDRLVDPEDEYTRFDDADLVRAGMDSLSAAHRATLAAVFIEGMSYEQTALRLGVPVGTVKSRVFTALRALRVVLEGSWDARRSAS